MKMSKGKIIASVIVAPLALFLILLLGGYVYLQTDSGRAILLAQIEAVVNDPAGLTIYLQQLDGNVFSNARLGKVILRDPQGDWLEATDLVLDWSPQDLLFGQLKINQISLASLVVKRNPDLPSAPEEEESTSSPLPLSIDISLGQLDIAKIDLAESMLGRKALLALSMKLSVRDESGIVSTLNIDQLDAHQGVVSARVNYLPDADTLSIDAQLTESQGGLIARALDLPDYPEVNFAITGQGPLVNWQGQLKGHAGELFETNLSLSSQGQDTITFNLSGTTEFSEKFASSLPLVDSKPIDMASTVLWDRENDLITLSSLEVANSNLSVSISGDVDLDKESVHVSASTLLLRVDTLNSLITPASLGRGVVDLDIAGDFQSMNITTTFQAGGIKLNQGAQTDTEAQNILGIGDIIGSISSDINLMSLEMIPVNASAALTEVSGLPPQAESLLGRNLRLELESHYVLESGLLNIPMLRARGAFIGADVRAAMATRENTASSKIAIVLDDLSRIAPIKGKLVTELNLQSLDVANQVTGDISITAQSLDVGEPVLQELVSTDPSLRANLNLGDGIFRISDVSLPLPVAQLTGAAELPATFESLLADVKVEAPELSRLNKVAGLDLLGAGNFETTLSGEITDPEAEGTLTLSALNLNQNKIGDLVTTFNAKTLASGASGGVDSELRGGILALDLAFGFSMADYGKLEVSDILLQTGQNNMSGTATVPFDGAPLIADIRGDFRDISSLGTAFGVGLAGAVSANAALTEKGGVQHLALDAKANNFSPDSGGTVIRNLDVTATSQGNFNDPLLVMTAILSDVSVQDRLIEQARLDVKGGLSNADFTFAVDSTMAPSVALGGGGKLTLPVAGKTSHTRFELSQLDGTIADKVLALRQALVVLQDQDKTSIDPFELALDGGVITGAGELTESSADAQVEIKTFPVDLVNLVAPDLEIKGMLAGKANLSLRPESAQGNLLLRAENIKLSDDSDSTIPPLQTTLAGSLNNNRFDFQNDVTGLEKSKIQAKGSVPLQVGLSPFSVTVLENQPLAGDLLIDSEIESLWAILALDTQEMLGKLRSDLKVSGTVANPQLIGTATVREGRYENIELGTLLKNITLDAGLENSQLLRLNLLANDNKQGVLRSEGTVRFENLSNPLVDLAIQLDNLAALDQDQIAVQTDGNIAIKGSPANMTVAGDITTRETNINIGSAVAPSVVDLEVTEINRPNKSQSKSVDAKAEKEQKPSNISLNLLLNMPRKVFIRGRGLDSEWEGRFTIKGLANAPVIEGYLSPVRGQFSFAGKNFKLRQGKIALLGGTQINPELDLSAIYEADNVTAVVSIQGTATNPKISFSSPDGLPEDEVLSQVLFGKASGKLSAVEALQLASAIASLSGTIDSGGGVLGFARDTLGVDVLTAGTNSDTGSPEVSAGKYITDNIYIGVDQGASADSTKAKVQIDLTPNITLESETGQTADSKVGVFWKWDY
ncbi:translocation/assembly module TamB domain-containing protein [Kiloniella sp. EL199]|uniref:translocation/assembly module TamB domain-containing protein n=1 Tax=Kiloniella sp. EL199 TaxID=2107581 RepID=UPI000EA0C8AE|nr:translocation/assembly module TamB domain-containing protein [Kiloniella sp. EL199]